MLNFFRSLRPIDMSRRDVFALIALAFSGIFPGALVVGGALIWLSMRWTAAVKALATGVPLALFCLSVSIPNDFVAAIASISGACAGILLAIQLLTLPAQRFDLPVRSRRAAV